MLYCYIRIQEALNCLHEKYNGDKIELWRKIGGGSTGLGIQTPGLSSYLCYYLHDTGQVISLSGPKLSHLCNEQE